MNSAAIVAFAAVLAVANAGYLAAPAAVGYHSQISSPAVYGNSYSTGIVRGAPLIGAYGAHGAHHSLVRVARGIYGAQVAPLAYGAHAAPLAYGAHTAPLAYAAHAAPLAYGAHAAPLAYASPALVSRSYHVNPLTYGGAAHIRVARGIYSNLHAAAPLTTYAAAPIAHSAHVAYAAPALRSVAYSAPIAHAAPLAYAAHSAPLAYAGAPAVYGHGYGLHGARAFL